MRAKFIEWGFKKNVVYKVINEKERYYVIAFDDEELEKIVSKLKKKLGKRFYKYVKIRKKTNFVKTIPFSSLKKLIPIPREIVNRVFRDNKLKAFIEASYKYSRNPIRPLLSMKDTNCEISSNNNYNYYLIWKADESYLEKCLFLFSYSNTLNYIVKPNKRQLRKLIDEMLIELVGDKNVEFQRQ
jgi:hypothetical protein